MKDENISSYTLNDIEGQIHETDWERVDKMTGEDPYEAAQSDPEATTPNRDGIEPLQAGYLCQ
jgi:hypothetical protein